MIKNLSQLKKAITAGRRFEIVEHFIKPEFTGQIRKPNVIQTNGFYSVVDGEPDNIASRYNDGKGSWMPYKKASNWKFDGDIITAFCGVEDRPCMAIRFID